MRKIIIITIFAAMIAGCAGVTDVVKTGTNTYMVASHGVMGWSSGPAQKAKAFQSAESYCSSIGKEIEVISSSEVPGGFGKIAAGEVNFKCISK